MNPSKVDDLDKLRRTVDDTVSRAGWPAPQWFGTTPDDPGLGRTRTAVESGAEVVFVRGGDGTVMSAASALVGTEVAMAVLPAGTGNRSPRTWDCRPTSPPVSRSRWKAACGASTSARSMAGISP